MLTGRNGTIRMPGERRCQEAKLCTVLPVRNVPALSKMEYPGVCTYIVAGVYLEKRTSDHILCARIAHR